MFSHFAGQRSTEACVRSSRQRRRLARWVFLLVAGMASLLSHADEVALSGNVYSHLTGQPLGGVAVRVWYPVFFKDEILALLTTAADGSFAWSGECTAPAQLCHVDINDQRHLYTDLTFDGGNSNAVVDFHLISPATIAGDLRIDGAMATEAVDVAVSYYSDEYDDWTGVVSTFEQKDGHYVVSGLPPGRSYRLCAQSAGTIEQCFDHHDRSSPSVDPAYDLVTVAEGESRGAVDFDFDSGGSISGTVHDAYLGAPLADTAIQFTYVDETGAWLGGSAGVTDSNGRYRLSGLLDGSFYAIVLVGDFFGPFIDRTQLYPGIVCEDNTCPPSTNGQLLTISNRSSLTAIDFTVHPAAVVRGRVTDATNGQGLGGISVYRSGDFRPAAVSAEGSGEYVIYSGEMEVPFRVLTQDSQPYIDQVYPGIACILYPCADAGQIFGSAVGSVAENVDFSLQPGGAVAGTIYDMATSLPRIGFIDVYDSAFNLVWSRDVDESGTYLSGAWYPGIYYIKARGYPGSHEFEGCAFYDARPCPAAGQNPADVMPTPIVLGAGEIRSGIDFRLDANQIFRSGFDG